MLALRDTPAAQWTRTLRPDFWESDMKRRPSGMWLIIWDWAKSGREIFKWSISGSKGGKYRKVSRTDRTLVIPICLMRSLFLVASTLPRYSPSSIKCMGVRVSSIKSCMLTPDINILNYKHWLSHKMTRIVRSIKPETNLSQP